MGRRINIQGKDGSFGAYVADGKTRGGPAIVVIARLADGRRAAANQASEAAFAELAAREPIGRRVRLETDAEGFNRFTFID